MRHLLSWLVLIDFLQIIRYYVVGSLVNAGGYAVFLLLLQGGMGHKLAASLLYLLGTLISFWLNRTLVFDSAVTLHSGIARLILMLGAGYVMNISILYVFVDWHGFHPAIVQLFSVVLVSVFFYLVNKFFVHRSQDQ